MKRFSMLFITLALIFACAVALISCADDEKKTVEDNVVANEGNDDEGPTNEEIEEALNENKTDIGVFEEPEIEFSAAVFDGADYVLLKDNSSLTLDGKYFEPGAVVLKYFKVENTSIKPCEWALQLVENEKMSKLAEVIDLYVYNGDVLPTDGVRRSLEGFVKLGTLKDFVALGLPLYEGMLVNGTPSYPCVAFKMQESAGSEYAGLTLENAVAFQFTSADPDAK